MPENFRTEAIDALGRHGLLTARQLQTISRRRPHIRSCRRILAAAAANGHIASVCMTERSRERSWFLTPVGIEIVTGTNPTPIRMSTGIATGPTAAHLAVVNKFGVAAIEALGDKAEVSWIHEEPLPLGAGRYVRPDAIVSVLVQRGHDLLGGEWFLEADRGTETIARLADKLANYLTYYNYRATSPADRTPAELHWRTRFRSWPKILFVFDCRDPHLRISKLAAWAGSDPRLANAWSKLSVGAITLEQATNLELLTSSHAITRIPTQETTTWIPD